MLTGRGGEGMVIKPSEWIVRGKKGLVQPAVKCRGKEYLRIIYGPDYDSNENLPRLRSRSLGRKRSLALREFALGIEALERFVRREPLRRIHECVFGVLAFGERTRGSPIVNSDAKSKTLSNSVKWSVATPRRGAFEFRFPYRRPSTPKLDNAMTQPPPQTPFRSPLERRDFVKLSAGLIGGLGIPGVFDSVASATEDVEPNWALDDSYLEKGLTGMARSQGWFNAHLGAAVLAGYYMCKENAFSKPLVTSIGQQLDGLIRAHKRQFTPFDNLSADKSADREGARIAQGSG